MEPPEAPRAAHSVLEPLCFLYTHKQVNTCASLPLASWKPHFRFRLARTLSFRLNPLLNDLCIGISLFSGVPGGNSSVRREFPRTRLPGKEPGVGAKSLRLLDNCCSTLASRAGSLLKWVVAYRSVFLVDKCLTFELVCHYPGLQKYWLLNPLFPSWGRE